MSKPQWRVVNNWMTVNREQGLAGALRPDKQAKFDELYEYTQHFRDQQAKADCFDIEVGGWVAEANTTNKAA